MGLPKFFSILLSALLFSMVACSANHVRLTPATTVPAATARAEVSQDKNGNTLVDLKVEHLAPPQNLTPSKSVYVVWIQPRGAAPIKQGQLKVNDKLNGEFKTPTSYKVFKIFVTAENSASVSSPSGQEVLRQEITRND